MRSSVTLSILQLLQNNGFGTIGVDLFWGKMGVDQTGIMIVDNGTSQSKGQRRSTSFEIFSRGKNDLSGFTKLQQVIDFLSSGRICSLPAVPRYTDHGFDNVVIMPLSTITNIGPDSKNTIIYNATGNIYY